MSTELRSRLFEELHSIELIDPHTHINPLAPASHTLADVLGYHYYTELAHSAGMTLAQIEDPHASPRERVARLVRSFDSISNTVQYSWFMEMSRELFRFSAERIDESNWESLYDTAANRMQAADWPQRVLAQSRLKAVFLTNDFDDPLEGFDTSVYIPCLRTDDLVFHLANPTVRERLASATSREATSANELRQALACLFQKFLGKNAKACAISLPPDFAPRPISDVTADRCLAEIAMDGQAATPETQQAAAHFVFWTLADLCAAHQLPFDLMIGVNRGVYRSGVYQGRDLFDSRVSLIQYRELLNAFPTVVFPISVLASVTNQELTSYSWIFPNVVTHGHWWYSNTPSFIEHDTAARLEAVPRTKQIGYYSDMYKLEFGLPKFNMYKRVLAKVLAERFVIDRGWSESAAVALGKQILRTNVDAVFFR
jgi:glucuronate isomerase